MKSSAGGPLRRSCYQAIAKADAVTVNVARLVRAPTLCLCEAPGEEGPGGADALRPGPSV